MSRGFKFFLLSVCGWLFIFQTNAQGLVGQDSTRRVITTAVPFLSITPDARSGGMGDVGVAISPDANAVHWNPAKLAFIEKDAGFSVSYTPWLGKIINDMSISYLSGYYKISREQAIGISLRYFDLGEIFFRDDQNVNLGQFNPRETAVDATYSRILTEYLSLGLTGRFIHSNLTGSFESGGVEARPGISVATDIGVFYDRELNSGIRSSKLAFGAVISNIGSKLTYSDSENADFIPTNLRIGTAYTTDLDPYNKITFALDLNKLMVPTPPIYQVDANGQVVTDAQGNPIISSGRDPDRPLLSGMFGSFADAPGGFREEMREIMVSAGVEYWYNDVFAVRAGYFYEHQTKGNRKYFTMGAGLRYNVFGLDLAYLVPQRQEHPLAETLRISLQFNFDTGNRSAETVVD